MNNNIIKWIIYFYNFYYNLFFFECIIKNYNIYLKKTLYIELKIYNLLFNQFNKIFFFGLYVLKKINIIIYCKCLITQRLLFDKVFLFFIQWIIYFFFLKKKKKKKKKLKKYLLI